MLFSIAKTMNFPTNLCWFNGYIHAVASYRLPWRMVTKLRQLRTDGCIHTRNPIAIFDMESFKKRFEKWNTDKYYHVFLDFAWDQPRRTFPRKQSIQCLYVLRGQHGDADVSGLTMYWWHTSAYMAKHHDAGHLLVAVESHVPAEGTEQPWRPIFCKAVRSFCVYFQNEVRMIYISPISTTSESIFLPFFFPLVSSKLWMFATQLKQII